MTAPKFFVIARVVGRDGALQLWKDRLVHLCKVSSTEPYGDSYYWGHDLDGENDTLWGLEGYTHPIGFFIDHVSSDIFKREMALVDKDELLKTSQGLTSPDYDLHHYDQVSGYLKRADDTESDSKDSFVVVRHYWTKDEGQRENLLDALSKFAKQSRENQTYVKSALVLKECRDNKLATLWIRVKSSEDWNSLHKSESFKQLTSELQSLLEKTESHHSQSFDGHLGLRD
ncbi:hypothetical protein FOVSG1_010076 [Fusarium oxysporum f. sp. vasinfectum]